AGVGGLSTPRLVHFGAADDGLAVRWESHDADPVPAHRLAGIDLADADRQLRQAVHAVADDLGDGGWVDAWQPQPPTLSERQWALPGDLPDRVRGLLVRAGSVLEIADRGLEHADASTTT